MTTTVRKIRKAAYARARGCCEHCGRAVEEASGYMRSAHLDHFWGRSKVKETLENCWILCAWCDHDKTVNHPSSTEWCERFRKHCIKHEYTEQLERIEARVQWNTAKGITLHTGSCPDCGNLFTLKGVIDCPHPWHR